MAEICFVIALAFCALFYLNPSSQISSFDRSTIKFLLFCLAVSGGRVIYKRFLSPKAQSNRADIEEDQHQQRVIEEADRRRANEQSRIAKEKLALEDNAPPIPTPAQFRSQLLAEYHAACSPPLVDNFLQQIVAVFVELYKPQTKYHAQLYAKTCLTGLLNFTKLIPAECRLQPQSSSPFYRLFNWRDLLLFRTGDKVDFRPGYREAYKALAEPLRGQHQALGFLDWSKRWEADFKQVEDFYPYYLALLDTPLYIRSDQLIPAATTTISFDIPDEARFRHQWIVGAPGAGKTTFISAMIADDLKRVANNECSIFVMDSQNELIPDIASLEVFAPGRPLHGRLIYLEPDPDYPLALNIFDTNKTRMHMLSSKDKAMLESGAIWMVEFFLSSLVKSEASPHQDTFLNYVIPALMAIPDATIFTFKDLLEGPKVKGGPSGYDRYKQHFTKLRPDTQQWLAERMHSAELAPTRNAIRTRLDGFTARGFFHDMFMHPRNKLDLFEELQTGKVVLINTMKGLLKNGTEPFGRYFIARLLQAAEERMFLARGERLPVYCYIDEASDYISEEENIEELLNKARKQKVGLIIANQMESQISSLVVREALSRAAIQCRGTAGEAGEPPHWEIAIGNKPPVAVQVPNVKFSELAKMSKPHFDEMLADMRRRFSSAPDTGQPQAQTSAGPSQWDVEWTATLSPKLAESGGLKKIHGFVVRIKPNTQDGTRVRLRGKGAKKPDGTFGDAFITYAVQQRPDQPLLGGSPYYSDERSDTDAQPW